METELQYYDDQYRKNFTGDIVRVEEHDGGWSIILKGTYFYPEGGGQPADRGVIGDAAIIDVKKREGIIHHLTADEPVKKSGMVQCSLDWGHRYDYMQQHTGQHVISGVLHKEGIGTAAVHQGEQYTSIETDCEVIASDVLERVEESVNEIVSKNLRVFDYHVTDDDIPGLKLRRPPKVSGRIRIVEIEGFDKVACGGVHTVTTGEVVFAKILFTEKIRGHVRIAWVLGNRVLKDYRQRLSVSRKLSDLLSTPWSGTGAAVEKLLQENNELRKKVSLLLKKSAEIEMESLFSSAEPVHGIPVITKEYQNEDRGLLKRLLSVLPKNREYAFCFVNRYGKTFQWALAVTVEGFDFAGSRNRLLAPIGGRGGGKPPFYQGTGEHPEGVDGFFDAFKGLFERAS